MDKKDASFKVKVLLLIFKLSFQTTGCLEERNWAGGQSTVQSSLTAVGR